MQCDTNDDEFSSQPLYDLTAPDGSKHYMLGTIHLGVGLADLSQEVITAFETADVYMAEVTTEAMMRKIQEEEEKSNTPAGHSLRQKLGTQSWLALRRHLPTLSEQELDSMTAKDVGDKMLGLVATNMEREKVLLDFQINLYGKNRGKSIIGLDEHIAPSHLKEEKLALALTISDLEKIIRCGGIPCLQTKLADMRTAWLQSDLDQMKKIVGGDTDVKQTYSGRDQAWVNSRIVQNNCRHGQTCLIYVGLAHLFDYPGSFATILKQNGYQIEKHRI